VDRIWGDVHLIFQPAEEGGGGAARMIDEGVLNNMEVETALGVHLWNEKPLGWFGISPGPIMAGAERFEIRVSGHGGHGGMPHLTRDPILASAAIISEAQTIVARNIDALSPAVLSFTHIEAGSSFNIIPAEVMMEGTIRTLAPATRTELIERFRTITEQIASAHACEASLSVEKFAPAVINDPDRAKIVAEVATDLFPDGAVDSDYRLMVSEDMAFFLDKIPGVFILVGSANHTLGLTSSHHTATFDFDEQALNNAVALLCAVIWQKVMPDD
jgi:amidohydrolase